MLTDSPAVMFNIICMYILHLFLKVEIYEKERLTKTCHMNV